MKSKALSIVLAGIFAATLFAMSTGSAMADYPRAYAGHVHHHTYGGHHHHSHGGHVHFSPGGVTFGNGRVGFSFGGGYAPNRYQFQPNYWGTRPQYVVPRYSNGTYRQFYIDPSNYQRNSVPYSYPAPYGTGVERYEFLRFQQETRDQLRQLSEQQRRDDVEQQQLQRGQQQLQLGQQRLEREQQDLERELQDIQNMLRK